jgi:hypothetical protein
MGLQRGPLSCGFLVLLCQFALLLLCCFQTVVGERTAAFNVSLELLTVSPLSKLQRLVRCIMLSPPTTGSYATCYKSCLFRVPAPDQGGLPPCSLQVVTAWNGQGISAFALAARILPAEQPPAGPCFPVDGCSPSTYMEASHSLIILVGQLIGAIG